VSERCTPSFSLLISTHRLLPTLSIDLFEYLVVELISKMKSVFELGADTGALAKVDQATEEVRPMRVHNFTSHSLTFGEGKYFLHATRSCCYIFVNGINNDNRIPSGTPLRIGLYTPIPHTPIIKANMFSNMKISLMLSCAWFSRAVDGRSIRRPRRRLSAS